ncbi:unnamed protein product, partial [Discosporangium mesarthrocarpum]
MLLERAARDQGDAGTRANAELGLILYSGAEGVAKDLGRAFRHLDQAAHSGDVPSAMLLASMYSRGLATRQDFAMAESWYWFVWGNLGMPMSVKKVIKRVDLGLKIMEVRARGFIHKTLKKLSAGKGTLKHIEWPAGAGARGRYITHQGDQEDRKAGQEPGVERRTGNGSSGSPPTTEGLREEFDGILFPSGVFFIQVAPVVAMEREEEDRLFDNTLEREENTGSWGRGKRGVKALWSNQGHENAPVDSPGLGPAADSALGGGGGGGGGRLGLLDDEVLAAAAEGLCLGRDGRFGPCDGGALWVSWGFLESESLASFPGGVPGALMGAAEARRSFVVGDPSTEWG